MTVGVGMVGLPRKRTSDAPTLGLEPDITLTARDTDLAGSLSTIHIAGRANPAGDAGPNVPLSRVSAGGEFFDGFGGQRLTADAPIAACYF